MSYSPTDIPVRQRVSKEGLGGEPHAFDEVTDHVALPREFYATFMDV